MKPTIGYSILFYAANIIFGVLAVASILPILFSPMFFDAPDSIHNIPLIIMVIGLLFYPFIYAACLAVSIVFRNKDKAKIAALIAVIPLFDLILVTSLFFSLD